MHASNSNLIVLSNALAGDPFASLPPCARDRCKHTPVNAAAVPGADIAAVKGMLRTSSGLPAGADFKTFFTTAYFRNCCTELLSTAFLTGEHLLHVDSLAALASLAM